MLFSLIDRLIKICINNSLIENADEIYIRNKLLALFHENTYAKTESISTDFYETLNLLLEEAISRGMISNSLYEKDIFSSSLMDIFLDKPSVINYKFNTLYKSSPQAATNYFYSLSKASNYIRMDRIEKNLLFKAHSKYGDIDITINLSKPEKDPKQIALEKNMNKGTYPLCLLCKENEGYLGTISHPDRSNHRTISLQINNENWLLQYSPYVYYNEHCILLSEEHKPMTISKNTFKNLLSFVEKFPHYFLGSNADLPIVGGSILAHEHYQGGCYEFPINKAKELFTTHLEAFKDVKIEALQWPLSTLRISSPDIEALVNCSNYIFEAWKNYSDEDLDIVSNTLQVHHNTITPIAKKRGTMYEMYLVLRNNRTSKSHPLGIFHPHEDVHHIKKENIGLIEVMGLAILPGRLKAELEAVKSYILGAVSIETVAEYHRPWAEELKSKYTGDINIHSFMELEVGKKFIRVLEDAGVYKLNDDGIKGFKRFVRSL